MATLTSSDPVDCIRRHGVSRVYVNGRVLLVEFKSSGLGRTDWMVEEVGKESAKRVFRYWDNNTGASVAPHALVCADVDYIEAVKRVNRWQHAEYVQWATNKGLPIEPMCPEFN